MSEHERFDFDDAAALLDKARALGVDMPFVDDIGVLLEPIEVAGRRLPNRIALHPMEGCDGQADGSPGELTARRYERFAAGGAGLIWFEATAVVPEGRANPRQLWIAARNVDRFARLLEQTRQTAGRSMGPAHEPLCILQLTHSGRYSRPEGEPGPIIARHCPQLDGRQGLPPDHPLISDDELDRLRGAYLSAAGLAARAGFDGVDVKACHGYLVSELLAGHTRTGSRYGGSFANRARFLLEVVAGIRDRLPDLIVTTRFNAFDGLPHPHGFGASPEAPGAGDLSEPQMLARALGEVGCPLLNVSAGNPYHVPHIGRPFDKPVANAGKPEEHPLAGVARLLRLAATVQRAVPDTPVVGTGYSWLRQHFPHVGAGVLRAGGAGIIGVGRLAFAYPDLVKDLAERGRLEPRKVCVACSGCSQIMRDGGRAGCVVRDQQVYAEQYRRGRRSSRA